MTFTAFALVEIGNFVSSGSGGADSGTNPNVKPVDTSPMFPENRLLLPRYVRQGARGDAELKYKDDFCPNR